MHDTFTYPLVLISFLKTRKREKKNNTRTQRNTEMSRGSQVMFRQPIQKPALPAGVVALENNFFHSHSLHIHFLKPQDHNCKVCHKYISGQAYGCDKLFCKFYIHTTCFKLPKTIRHPSHSVSSFTLFARSPYVKGEFICRACGATGDSFHYHSSDNFDLHIQCAALPASVIVNRSKTLMLWYLFPIHVGPLATKCNMCRRKLPNNRWVDYHENSRFISHLKCAVRGNGTSAIDIQQRLQTMVPILSSNSFSSSSARSWFSRVLNFWVASGWRTRREEGLVTIGFEFLIFRTNEWKC